MIDDTTLSVALSATSKVLEFKIKTPYAKRKLLFEDAHHLASLAFWSERALAMRGNPLIRFGPTHRSGMLFWEHKETQAPFVRFEFGEQQKNEFDEVRFVLFEFVLKMCAARFVLGRAGQGHGNCRTYEWPSATSGPKLS